MKWEQTLDIFCGNCVCGSLCSGFGQSVARFGSVGTAVLVSPCGWYIDPKGNPAELLWKRVRTR